MLGVRQTQGTTGASGMCMHPGPQGVLCLCMVTGMVPFHFHCVAEIASQVTRQGHTKEVTSQGHAEKVASQGYPQEVTSQGQPQEDASKEPCQVSCQGHAQKGTNAEEDPSEVASKEPCQEPQSLRRGPDFGIASNGVSQHHHGQLHFMLC